MKSPINQIELESALPALHNGSGAICTTSNSYQEIIIKDPEVNITDLPGDTPIGQLVSMSKSQVIGFRVPDSSFEVTAESGELSAEELVANA